MHLWNDSPVVSIQKEYLVIDSKKKEVKAEIFRYISYYNAEMFEYF